MRREKSAASDNASFIAVLAAEFIALMGFSASTPVLPSFLRELGIEDRSALKLWSGLSIALPSVMVALFSPLWGALADSRGRKPMLLRALFGSAVFIGLIAFAAAPWQLLALRTLQGCVTGTVAAATVLVAANAPEGRLGKRLGFLQAAVFLGNSMGPAIGGRIAEIVGNRGSFVFASLLLAAGGLIVFRLVVENFSPLGSVPGGDKIRAEHEPIAWAGFLPLFSVIFAYQLAGTNVTPVLPIFVEDLMPDPTLARSMSGVIIGSASIASAVSAVAAGRLSDRFGPARVLLVSLALAAVLSASQAFARSPWSLLALRAASGLFLGGTMPSVNALITNRAPSRSSGRIFGFSTSVGQAGASFGPMMGAGLAIVFGSRSVFIATGALLALIAAGIALNARKGRASNPP